MNRNHVSTFIVYTFVTVFHASHHMLTRSLVGGYGGKERHESGTAEELGDEEGGVSLGLWVLYPH